MITVLLPVAIAVIMCSLGLTLIPADFGRVSRSSASSP